MILRKRDKRIRTLFVEIAAIYSAIAERNGLLSDTEFNAIQSKHAEIDLLLSPITQTKTTNQPTNP